MTVELNTGHALKLVGRYGLAVFAVEHGGKVPAVRWRERSTLDPDAVVDMFGAAPRNIGVDCGRSRVFVIDEDTAREWDRACRELGIDPPLTLVVRTSKGRHVYFRQPAPGPPITNSEGALRGYGLNVRGEGGYVVGPGSLHADGTLYGIEHDADIADPPAELVAALRAGTAHEGPPDADGYREIVVPAPDRWWLDAEEIEAGKRHAALVAAAGWCNAKRLPIEAARPIVLDVLARCAGDTYTEADALARLADVYERYRAGEIEHGEHEHEAEAVEADDDASSIFLDWPTFWAAPAHDGEWLHEDVLALGRAHALYAERKQGKSLFTLAVVVELAVARTDVDVIYLDYEMTEDDVRERLEDMGHGPDADLTRLHYALLPSLPPLDTAEGAGAVLALVDRVERPGGRVLVVIDTTGRAVEGDENSADTIRAFYAWTGIALKRRGVTWARLDHAGKDPTKGQRGTSAKGDDVDVVWELRATDDGIELRRKLTRMSWVPERVRFARRDDPLRFDRVRDGWPAGTGELVAELDRLDVPLDAGRRAAARVLREHEIGARNEVIGAALRFRRERPLTVPRAGFGAVTQRSGTTPGTTPGDSAGTTAGTTTSETHADQGGDHSGDHSGPGAAVDGDQWVPLEGGPRPHGQSEAGDDQVTEDDL